MDTGTIKHHNPRVNALLQRFTQIIEASKHPDLAKLYCRWRHCKIADDAGIPSNDIYDVARKYGLHPPDVGRAWFEAEAYLEQAYQREQAGQQSENSPFLHWAFNFAADLADDHDPASLLVQNIAEMGCLEFDETHPANLLPELALAAKRSGADGRADQLRRMAEQPVYDVDDDTSAAVS